MNKLFVIILLSVVSVGSILSGCQTSAEKEAALKLKIEQDKVALEKQQQEARDKTAKDVINAEWANYKIATEVRITDNEARIAELRAKKQKPGKTLDALYEKKISMLEEQNKNLRIRLYKYEENQSEWESFKREFNHDMDELAKALKDLTVDNKN